MITTLRISGMTCNGCVKHVDTALRAIPGVSAVDVSLADQAARISHDPEQSSLASLIGAVEAAGYDAATADATSPA